MQGNECHAVRRADQGRELHELPFSVIESGAAAASLRKCCDRLAIFQPEPSERLNSQGGVNLDNAQRHASPMAAGSIVARAARSKPTAVSHSAGFSCWGKWPAPAIILKVMDGLASS